VWLSVRSDVQLVLPRLVERLLAIVFDGAFSAIRIWA